MFSDHKKQSEKKKNIRNFIYIHILYIHLCLYCQYQLRNSGFYICLCSLTERPTDNIFLKFGDSRLSNQVYKLQLEGKKVVNINRIEAQFVN